MSTTGITLRTQADIDATNSGTTYATINDLPADYTDTTVEATLNIAEIPHSLFLGTGSQQIPLKKITLGEEVKTIGMYSFMRSQSLEEVIIETSQLTEIGEKAFGDCKMLGKLGTTQEIEGFNGSSILKIPDSVTTIGVEAFRGIQTNYKIVLPTNDSYTGLATHLFRYSWVLEVQIPDNVTSANSNTFEHAFSRPDEYALTLRVSSDNGLNLTEGPLSGYVNNDYITVVIDDTAFEGASEPEPEPEPVFTPANKDELVSGLNAYFDDNLYGRKRDGNHDISTLGLKDSNSALISNVESLGPIGSWDVSSVTTFVLLFFNKSNFNEDIGAWDVSNVTNMYMMFRGATAYKQDISNWNVSKVTTMMMMFSYIPDFDCDLRTKVVPIEGSAYLAWDVSSVTDMYKMFAGTTSYDANSDGTPGTGTQLNWNLNETVDLDRMFETSHGETLYGVTPIRSKFLGNTIGQDPYTAFTSITDFTESENYTINVVEGASAQETLFLNVPDATNFKLEILDNGDVKVATDGTTTNTTANGGTLALSAVETLTNQNAFYELNGTTRYGEITYDGLKATLTYTAASNIDGISKLSENLQVKASYTDLEGQDKTVTLTVAITNLETKHYVADETEYTINLVTDYGAEAGTSNLETTVTNFADTVVTADLTHNGVTIPHIFTYTLPSNDPQALHDAGFSATELYNSGKFEEAQPLEVAYTKQELQNAGYTFWYVPNDTADDTADDAADDAKVTVTIYHHPQFYDRLYPLSDFKSLIEDDVASGTSLNNSIEVRTELKKHWRFKLKRVSDDEIFDVTFTDPGDVYYSTGNGSRSTNYLYFWTNPRLETAVAGNKTYEIEQIYTNVQPVVITLTGDATMTLNVGTNFSDPGTTTDVDGVTVTVTGTVNKDVVGTYTLTYTADGATEDKVRTVTVLPTVQNVNATAVKNQPTSFFLKYNGL